MHARDILGMQWILIGTALALFVAWILIHFIVGISLGILNLIWMIAILFAVLAGVQLLES